MNVDPEIVLNELLDSATKRTQSALKILNSILEKQATTELKDFSYATIGKLSAQAGGPSTQTIRNRTGKHFQQLISAWATFAGTTTKKPLSVRQKQQLNGNDQQVLDAISDPVLKAVVGTIIAERNRFRDQLNVLKSQTELFLDKTKSHNPEPKSSHAVLTPMEIEALQQATSESFAKRMNWTVKPTGQVLDSEGNEIYQRGYWNALNKVITH
ncbi:alpha/beta hydrolase [Shewanella sp. OPT22]|nr:alpha/beta hydrolase [Shewanella sp. OPT22]